MAFDFLGKKNNERAVRVGYIHPDKGYVKGLSIYEANLYAAKHPGTQFVIETREKVRYLNINELNSFKFDKIDPCSELKPIDIDSSPCKDAPIVNISGDGVGAQANVAIGKDGSIMSVDIIHGGFGYRTPPTVDIRSKCDSTKRVPATAIVGTSESTIIDYSSEVEIIDLETLAPNYKKDDYGDRKNLITGETDGVWDPRNFASIVQSDPISEEVRKWQDFILRKSSKDFWWNSRTATPLSVVGDSLGSGKKLYPVEHWSWGGERTYPEKEMVDVPFDVYSQGSDRNRNIEFTFTSLDGEHSFKISPNFKKGQKEKTVVKKVRINTKYRVVSNPKQGSKNKSNNAIEQGLIDEFGRKPTEINAAKNEITRARTIFADYVRSDNDNDDIQVTSRLGKFTAKNKSKVIAKDAKDDLKINKRGTYEILYKFLSRKDVKREPTDTINDTFMNKYAVCPVAPSDREGSSKAGKIYYIKWREYFPYKGDYTFKGISDSYSEIFLTREKTGDTIDIMDIENTSSITNNNKSNNSKSIKERVKNLEEGYYTIEAVLENVSREYKKQDSKESIFSTKKDINNANRKLWRSNSLSKSNFSQFFQRYGVLPFNPVSKNNVTLSDPKVVFKTENDLPYVEIKGEGRVKVDFRLSVSDKTNVSGIAFSEIRIDTDDNQLILKRNLDKTSEKIVGSAKFTAGKKYRIHQIGGSKDSAFKSKDQTNIMFDDDASNSFDQNGNLQIMDVKRLGSNAAADVMSSDSFAGTHTISWKKVDFPYDGIYNIRTLADDSAEIYIVKDTNKTLPNDTKTKRSKAEKVVTARRNFLTKETHFFEKGKYLIEVDLTQKPGKTINKGNPMGIAIDINFLGAQQVSGIDEEDFDDISSWNENPFGIALAIQPPNVPEPKEPNLKGTKNCPPNPIWTTRSTKGGSEKWYPVYHKDWSFWMNRFAMSPLKPKSSESSSGGGQEFTKTWDIDVPMEGEYAIGGLCDDTGSIRVTSGGKEHVEINLQGFKTQSPRLTKFYLEEGKHKIRVKVKNSKQLDTFVQPKNIFDTSKWVNRAPKLDVDIFTQEIICHAGGGYGGLSSGLQTRVGIVKVGEGGNGGAGGGEIGGGNEKNQKGNGGGAGLRNGKVANKGKGDTIDGGYGVDLDGKQAGSDNEVRSRGDNGGDGANFGGGGGGQRKNGRAGRGGNGAVKIVWGSTGKSKEWTKPGKYTVEVPKSEPGRDHITFVKVYCIGGGGSGFTDPGAEFGGGGGSGGAYAVNKVKVVAGTKLEVVVGRGGGSPKKKTSNDGGDSYVRVTEAEFFTKDGSKPQQITKVNGATYEGPPIASYIRNTDVGEEKLGPYLSPLLPYGKETVKELSGKKWFFSWIDVDFEIDGNYEFLSEVDDDMIVKVNGVRIFKTTKEDGQSRVVRKMKKGKYRVDIVLKNDKVIGANFKANPVYCALKINALKNKQRDTDTFSWEKNPVAVSAIMIPPPCPQQVGGGGVITEIIPRVAGFGFTSDSDNTYPAMLTLDTIDVENGGINYHTDDPVIIVNDNLIDVENDIAPPNKIVIPGGDPNDNEDDDDDGTGGGGRGTGGGLGGGTTDDPDDGDGAPNPSGLGPSGPGINTSTSGISTSGSSIVRSPFDGESAGGGRPGGSGGPGGDGIGSGDGLGDGTGDAGAGDGLGDGGPIRDGDGIITVGDRGLGGALDSGRVNPVIYKPDGTPYAFSGPEDNSRLGLPVVKLVLGPFGKIVRVDVLDSGAPFTSTPTITVLSNTGVNAVLRPRFKLERDPLNVDPKFLLQVTDLVGLKQTGYIDGRAYYGKVYSKNGLLFAGAYETPGDPVRVYSSLQDSITRVDSTQPSAIIRQGSDVRSNDPRLNIPGTPDNLA